jgi:DNA-binding Xre family transcriptional regulator
MSRRSARGQQLPPQEVELLNTLQGEQLFERIAALYNEGWPLQAMGDALSPKHPRSTIRVWVQRAKGLNTIDAPIPTPKAVSLLPKVKLNSPGIPRDTLEIIQELAPLARRFRSRMATTAAQAVANDRLTGICITLYQKGVSIKELAEAAGVTYRAMYKRIKL